MCESCLLSQAVRPLIAQQFTAIGLSGFFFSSNFYYVGFVVLFCFLNDSGQKTENRAPNASRAQPLAK